MAKTYFATFEFKNLRRFWRDITYLTNPLDLSPLPQWSRHVFNKKMDPITAVIDSLQLAKLEQPTYIIWNIQSVCLRFDLAIKCHCIYFMVFLTTVNSTVYATSTSWLRENIKAPHYRSFMGESESGFPSTKTIESTQTTSMEDVSTGVLEKIKNI